MSTQPQRIAILLQRTVEHDSRVRREASALAAAGHDVVLLEHAPTGPDIPGVVRRPVLRARAWAYLPHRVHQATLMAAFAAAAVRERPDAVHAHDVAMLLPGLVAATVTHAPLVYDTHELASGVLYRRGFPALVAAAIERVSIPRCAAVVTVSDGIADRLARRHPRGPRPVVLRNVCDLPRPATATASGGLRERLGLREHTPLLLYLGAAAPGRGCEAPIRALAAVPGAHLAFVGDAEPGHDEALAELARREGAEANVHFLGNLPLEALLGHVQEADAGVAVFDGTSENHRLTLPNKLFEFLAAGLPVLAASGTETGRVVDEHGIGWTVDAREDASVAEGMRRALAECREPAVRARVRAADACFEWARERERLLAVYETAATNGAQPRAVASLLLVRNPFSHDARVLRAARLLREMGYQPAVVALRTRPEHSRTEVVDGVPVLRIAHDPAWVERRFGRHRGPEAPATEDAGLARPGAARRAYRALRTLDFHRRAIGVVLRERPALVHCNDFNTMWIGVFAKLLTGSRVVYDSHELWPDRNGRSEWRPGLLAAEALFVRIADRVVTVSPGMSEAMASRYGIAPPDVVLNVPATGSNGSQPAVAASPVAVYVGQLLAGRGLEQAIDAVALVPGLRLRIIGPGDDGVRARLRQRAEAAGVADRLEIMGGVEPDAVVAAIAGASIGLSLFQPVCRSHELTLPNKLHEYVMAGVPVLSSDVPESAAYVRRHGVGEVVPAADIEAIARGMARLLEPDRIAELRPRLELAARELNWERERERLRAAYLAALA